MSLKSNIYWCVPGCTEKGKVDPEGNRVGFFWFPKGHKSSTRMAGENTARCWPAF